MSNNSDRLISKPVFYALVGIGLLVFLLYALKGVVAVVLLSFLLAYAFDPLVYFLSDKRVPHTLACVICLVLLLVVGASLVALILPALQVEIVEVSKSMPGYLEKIQLSAIPWIEQTFGIDVPANISEALTQAKSQLGGGMSKLAGPVTSVLKGMLSGTLTLLSKLIYLIIIPLFTFYFLKDYRKITAWFKELIPPRHRERTVSLLTEVDSVLAGFLRGQLTICSVLSIVYSIALSIIGVPAAITIGIVAGLFNMVPYLGTATGLLLSFLFLLLEGSGWSTYVIVACLFTVVSVADGLFMTPKILGNKLGLAPVMVILAILAFGELFGFLGVLMAVPVTAIGKVLGGHALVAYKNSKLFKVSPAGEQSSDAGEPKE